MECLYSNGTTQVVKRSEEKAGESRRRKVCAVMGGTTVIEIKSEDTYE